MRATTLFLFWLLLIWQTGFTCSTALTHTHDDIREAEIVVTAWVGCTLTGTISDVPVQFWADSSTCSLRDKVPGTFQIRFDATCGQVLELSDGPLSPYCAPGLPTPTPTPTPSPSPLRECQSNEFVGNPPQCLCLKGFKGKSGKCK